MKSGSSRQLSLQQSSLQVERFGARSDAHPLTKSPLSAIMTNAIPDRIAFHQTYSPVQALLLWGQPD
jgi:hypothetical protein